MSTFLLLEDLNIGPSDFAAWSDEINMCACNLCSDVARFRPLDFTGRWALVAAVVLLDALKAGRHTHVSYRQAAATARARAIVNGTYGRTVFKTGSTMQTGIGAGVTPGGVR